VKKRAAVAATSLHSDEYIKMIQYRNMINYDVPGLSSIKFPEEDVVCTTPNELYVGVVAPQTDPNKKLTYLPGFITTGGAINIPGIREDIGRVIQENRYFAYVFWQTLLAHPKPTIIPGIGNMRETQLFSPHNLARCAFPDETGVLGDKPNFWAEYDFYVMQFAWVFGLKPELFVDFNRIMLEQVNLPILKSHSAPREERDKEAAKVANNIQRFFGQLNNPMRPIDSMVVLPNPDMDKVQSLGTALELQVAKDFGIPVYHTVIHPEVVYQDAGFSPVMRTTVGEWMIEELLRRERVPNPTNAAVSLVRRQK
jgi:hypothetical protein